MAAPHVAGVAALVLQHTPLAPADLEAHLRGTGQCPDNLQNQSTGNCTGPGTWEGDPDLLTDKTLAEPMVNAFWATGATVENPDAAPTVTVTSPTDGVHPPHQSTEPSPPPWPP